MASRFIRYMENNTTDHTAPSASGDVTSDASLWYVLRDLTRYNAKMPGYKLLEKEGIKSFTPMHSVLRNKDGRNIRVREPVVRSLVFAYSSKEILDTLTGMYPTLQFRYVYGKSINDPMIVPKKDMDRFIRAVESSTNEPVYYSPEEIPPDKYGREVRIIGGDLDGYTGRLLRMQGSKVKRLIVELPGFFAAGVEVRPEYIRFI